MFQVTKRLNNYVVSAQVDAFYGGVLEADLIHLDANYFDGVLEVYPKTKQDLRDVCDHIIDTLIAK